MDNTFLGISPYFYSLSERIKELEGTRLNNRKRRTTRAQQMLLLKHSDLPIFLC